MSREELRDGYVRLMEELYEPDAYFERLGAGLGNALDALRAGACALLAEASAGAPSRSGLEPGTRRGLVSRG